MFHFMLFAFTYGWDGMKYQYYRYIPYLLIGKQLVRMVCLFWDKLGRAECQITSQVLPGKNFGNIIFVREKINFDRAQIFHGGPIFLRGANKNARVADPRPL